MNNKFNINDYTFKVVEMDVYSHFNRKKALNDDFIDNKIKYFFLVDEMNIIHDWKIQFDSIAFKQGTTASHKKSKEKNLSFLLRKKIFDIFGIKHEFCQSDRETKKLVYSFDKKDINKFSLNQHLWSFSDFSKITIQNIAYILTGSNPKGEGDSKSVLFTMYNNERKSFGFFLKSLNKSNEIRSYLWKKLGKDSYLAYKTYWDEYKNNKIKIISFSEWIEEFEILKKYFDKFSSKDEKIDMYWWKKVKNEFESEAKLLVKNWINLNNKISSLRAKQKINYRNWLSQEFKVDITKNDEINKKTYELFFNLNEEKIPSKFEYAHIYPVKKIKSEFLKSNSSNEKYLEKIFDINNFLPLPSDIHNYYDSGWFYWNESGNIKFCENLLSKQDSFEIEDKFSKINDIILEDRKIYLIDYLKKVLHKKQK